MSTPTDQSSVFHNVADTVATATTIGLLSVFIQKRLGDVVPAAAGL